MTTPHTLGSAVPALANRVLPVACAILALTLVAGCSSTPAGTQAVPKSATVEQTAVPGSAQNSSETAIPAPTNLVTAKLLLQEKRAAFTPGQPGNAVGGTGFNYAVGTKMDTPSSTAHKFAVPLRFPNPALVGAPSYMLASQTKSGAHHASAAYSSLTWAAISARGKVYDFASRVQTGSAGSNSLHRYSPGDSTGFATLVSVRGNLGVATTRYSVSGQKSSMAAPSRVEWVEGGVHYEIYSNLDPDQLLAIAGTMVLVKP